MITDLILDRKEGSRYNPHDFYMYIGTSPLYGGLSNPICYAMDYGTNKDVQNALCDYIAKGNYNPEIKHYIRSVNWIEME